MFKVIIYSNSIKEFEKINPWKAWLEELPEQIQNRIIPYQLESDRQMRILGKIQLKQLLRDFGLLNEDVGGVDVVGGGGVGGGDVGGGDVRGRNVRGRNVRGGNGEVENVGGEKVGAGSGGAGSGGAGIKFGEGNIRGKATILDLNNLCYSEYNKPYFKVDAPEQISQQPFYFNTSHSGGLTVCAGTLMGDIGVDVEQVSGSEKIIENLNGGTGEIPELTIQLWTAQEAAHKAAGWGVMNGLGEQVGILEDGVSKEKERVNTNEIFSAAISDEGIYKEGGAKDEISEGKSYARKFYDKMNGIKIVELELPDGYVGHVAVRTADDFEVEYRRIELIQDKK